MPIKNYKMKNQISKSRIISMVLFLVLPSMITLLIAFNLSLTAKTAAALPDSPTSSLNWSTPFAITSSSNGATFPVVRGAPDGKTVMVVYNQNMDSNNPPINIDPYYRLSTDNGKTWGNPIAIASTAAKSQHIRFDFTSNGLAHAAWWEGTNLVYANSSNWASRKTLASVSTSDSISQLFIVTSGTNIIDIVWVQGNPELNIYHARSTDGGSTWPINAVVKPTGFISLYPSMAVDATGNIHIVWQENDNTETIFDPVEPRLGGTVYYVKSTSIGSNSVTWSNQIEISNVVDAREPEIVADGNSVYVTYTEYNGVSNQYIQYVQCQSQCTQSQNWSQPVRIFDQLLGSNTKPVNLVSSLTKRGNCVISYFHGIHPDNMVVGGSLLEYMYGDSSCSNWNSVDTSQLADDVQTVNPSIATQNNWWLYLTYEQGDGNHNQIYFLQSKPNIYLPVIFK